MGRCRRRREKGRPLRSDVIRVEMAGSASTSLRLTVHGMEPAGMNGVQGLLRQPWHVRRNMLSNYSLIMRSKGPLPSFKGPVDVEYFRSYRAQPMDIDNLTSSFKLIGDALVKLGVVEDDSPDILHLTVAQGKRGGFPGRFSVLVKPRKI